MILGPVWSLFLTFFAIQEALNGLKSYSITILYWWRPLGAILRHFGPFGAHLEALEQDIEGIGSGQESTWCYPDLVLAPLNDESAASPAFYSLNMFHKTESPSISLKILKLF